jgi:hypothetical protein
LVGSGGSEGAEVLRRCSVIEGSTEAFPFYCMQCSRVFSSFGSARRIAGISATENRIAERECLADGADLSGTRDPGLGSGGQTGEVVELAPEGTAELHPHFSTRKPSAGRAGIRFHA